MGRNKLRRWDTISEGSIVLHLHVVTREKSIWEKVVRVNIAAFTFDAKFVHPRYIDISIPNTAMN